MRLEYSLLSVLMSEPSAVVTLTVKPEQFTAPGAPLMFSVIQRLASEHRVPDVVLVAEEMDRDDPYDQHLAMVMDVADTPGVVANLDAYEAEIIKAHRRRQERTIAHTLVNALENGVDTAAAEAMASLQALDEGVATGVVTARESVKTVITELDAISKHGKEPGLTTGLSDLDMLLGGMQKGDCSILAARTSVGKTAVMCNFALAVNAPVGIVSAEQSHQQLTQRMLSNLGRIKSQRFRTGKLDDDDYPRLSSAVTCLVEREIYIEDKPSPTIDEVEKLARRLVWEHGIRVLFIDYVQKVRSDAYKDRYLQVGDVSRRVYALAKDLNIPIMMLAQLSRNAEGKEPTLADLRESGDLEQDADQVMFLHRTQDPGELNLIVAKNRFGPIAHTTVRWEPEFMTISDL
jgi:replicative DNA helicase